MLTLRLNDFILSKAQVIEEKLYTSEQTHNSLKKWIFISMIQGEENIHRFNDVKDQVIDFEITGILPKTRALLHNVSSFSLENEDILNAQFTVTQLDPEYDPQVQSLALQVSTMVSINVLKTLLIEKGVFTREEWDSRMKAAMTDEDKQATITNLIALGLQPNQ